MKLKLDIENSTNENCFRLFFSNTSLVSLPTKNAILKYELSENHYFIIILVVLTLISLWTYKKLRKEIPDVLN